MGSPSTPSGALIATDDYSFNAAGGAPTPASGSGLDGTTITLPGAPTQAGYAFAGWNDGTTTYGAGATYTLSSGGTPIVFTAQWGANATDDYSFNPAGGSPTPTVGLGPRRRHHHPAGGAHRGWLHLRRVERADHAAQLVR